MEQLPPTQEERRRKSDELIEAAKRGEHIDINSLNPLETSSETIGYIRVIQSGRVVLDSIGINLQ